jgi:hypothetical protein
VRGAQPIERPARQLSRDEATGHAP